MAVVWGVVVILVMICVYFYKIWNKKGEKVPKINKVYKNILTTPATVLVQKIRCSELTVEDILIAYIDRIKIVNTTVNAIVQERFDSALKEAQEIDELLKSMTEEEKDQLFESKVLLGVPFTNKECFGVKGMYQTAGLVSRKDCLATENAVVVQRLLDAGAILVATSNVSELCMWWESSNHVYGTTNNPYDSSCMVGGSSGGEGAIIAAAGSLIGIGSDIGGSIRMPAFFNGIFGHKPSSGIVPNDGQFPNAAPGAQDLLCTGPMCRYATDLRTVFQVMSGDPVISDKLQIKPDMSKLQFYSIATNNAILVSNVSQELANAQEKVCDFLEKKHNVKVNKIELHRLKYSLDIWSLRMSNSGGPTFCQLLGGGVKPINPVWELAKWCCGMSPHTLPALCLGVLEKFSHFLPHMHQNKVLKSGDKLIKEVEELLGSNGVLLYPSHPTTALCHNLAILKPFNFVYTAIFNVLHLPVTQCPLGLDSDGLPLGIQVVAGRNNDHLTLIVAEELEKEFGGWVSPE